jgi:hypothetical protein
MVHPAEIEAPPVPPVVVPPMPFAPPFASYPAKLVDPPSVPSDPLTPTALPPAPPVPPAPTATDSVEPRTDDSKLIWTMAAPAPPPPPGLSVPVVSHLPPPPPPPPPIMIMSTFLGVVGDGFVHVSAPVYTLTSTFPFTVSPFMERPIPSSSSRTSVVPAVPRPSRRDAAETACILE